MSDRGAQRPQGGARKAIYLTKLIKFTREIRTAMWFRPAVCSLLAAAVALVIAGVDQSIPEAAAKFLPIIDGAAAKDLLRLVAGGMLTVTTVTLSVTMLVLNLAANQASPRAVPELMADPITQNALSTFLATFVFAVAALGMFGFEAVSGAGVTLMFGTSMLLGIWAIRYLLQWMHHVAASTKLNRIIVKIYDQAGDRLDTYFAMARTDEGAASPSDTEEEDGALVRARTTGYVQLVNVDSMAQSAESLDLRVKLHAAEGDFVYSATPLMTVWGETRHDEDAQAQLARSVAIGGERTPEDDPRLGIEILSEIACRALSPSMNDPQSAIVCINYLAALLTRAGQVPASAYPVAVVKGGRVTRRVIAFDQFLIRAFRPVVREGAGQVEVVKRVLYALAEMVPVISEDHLKTVAEEADRAAELARDRLTLEDDRNAVEEAAKAVKAALHERD